MSDPSRVARGACAGAAALLAAALWPPPAHGFSNVAVGDPIENVQLPTLDGKNAPLLGQAQANVFVFVRPNQDHSLQVLTQMAELEKKSLIVAEPPPGAGGFRRLLGQRPQSQDERLGLNEAAAPASGEHAGQPFERFARLLQPGGDLIGVGPRRGIESLGERQQRFLPDGI